MTFLMGLNRWYSTPKSDAKAIHKLDTLFCKFAATIDKSFSNE